METNRSRAATVVATDWLQPDPNSYTQDGAVATCRSQKMVPRGQVPSLCSVERQVLESLALRSVDHTSGSWSKPLQPLSRRRRPYQKAWIGARIGPVTICLVILVALSFPAFAASPQWIADPRSGCKVWNENPQPNESISWTGGCRGGLALGRGILQWFKNGKADERFDADFRDGRMDGHCIYSDPSGDRFDGECRNGRRSGHGVYIFANRNRYDGEFRDDKKDGHGVYAFANGSRYDGYYRNDLRDGHGVFTEPDGTRYDGEWRSGLPNGTGTITSADGQTYSGNWSSGCFSQGRMRITMGVTKEQCGF